MKRLIFIFAALLLAVSVNAQKHAVMVGAQILKGIRNPSIRPRPIINTPNPHRWGTIIWQHPQIESSIRSSENLRDHAKIEILSSEVSKLQRQYADERKFHSLARACLNGEYDNAPEVLLSTACKTEKYNLVHMGVSIASRAMKTADISSELLLRYSPKSEPLIKQWQKMSSHLAETLFTDRLSAGAVYCAPDLDQWELFCKNNREMSEKYSPTHTPLLKIVESPDLDEAVQYAVEAADSVIAHPKAFNHTTKENLFPYLLDGLMFEQRHSDALDYFGREPLKTYADTTAACLLNLTTCALVVQDQDKFDTYLNKALVLDSALTMNYLQDLFNSAHEEFLASPDLELGKWLVESSDAPAAEALKLYLDLMDAFDVPEPGWEWRPDSVYTQDEQYLKELFIELFDFAIAVDEGRTPSDNLHCLKLFKLDFSINDNSDLKNVENEFIAFREELADNSSPQIYDLRTQLIISQAFIAGHGLDKPKQALKILKKNIDFLLAPEISPDMKASYYNYMSTLYAKMGKKKDAEKYRILANETNQEAEKPTE